MTEPEGGALPEPGGEASPLRPSGFFPARRLSFEELREVLTLSLRAGQLMVENGANTARVERTVSRLGTALGAESVDVYVTPNVIVATDVSGGEHRTKVRRIVRSGIDLNKMAQVLELSFEAAEGKLDRRGVREALERISVQPRLYTRLTTTAAIAFAAGCLSILFGGDGQAAAAAVGACAAGHLAFTALGRSLWLGRYLRTLVVASFSSALAQLLAQAFGSETGGIAMLSAVVHLAPGVLMIGSVADLFRGDSVSGVARGASAIMIVATIGAGLWGTLLLSGYEATHANLFQPPALLASGAALGVAFGFSVLFDVPGRALLWSTLVGGVAYLARLVLVLPLGVPLVAATFLAGGLISLLAYLLARATRFPAPLFITPSFIPLVPGVPAFQSVLEMMGERPSLAVDALLQTVLLIGALAAGIGAVDASTRKQVKGAARQAIQEAELQERTLSSSPAPEQPIEPEERGR